MAIFSQTMPLSQARLITESILMMIDVKVETAKDALSFVA